MHILKKEDVTMTVIKSLIISLFIVFISVSSVIADNYREVIELFNKGKKSSDDKETERLFKDALKLPCENKKILAEIHSHLAWLYYSRSNRLYEAIAEYRNAIYLEPYNPGFYIELGDVYSVIGELDSTEKYLDKGLTLVGITGEREHSLWLLNLLNYIYGKLGDYPKILSCAEKALKLGLEEKYYCAGIGTVYYDLGDYSKALSYYAKALKADTGNGNKADKGRLLASIGLVYFNLGDYSEALSYYEQALHIKNVNKRTAWSSEMMEFLEAYIGDVYLAQGKVKEAYEMFNKTFVSPRFCNNGRYYLQIRDYQNAKDMFSHDLMWNWRFGAKFHLADYIGLGLAYEGLKDYQKAKEYFKKV